MQLAARPLRPRRPFSPAWPLVATLALSFAGSGLHAETFDLSLAASRGETAVVEIDFGEGLRPDPGSVRISSHSSRAIEAHVEASGWGSWDVEVTLERRAGAPRLDVRARGATTWLFGGPNIRVDVAVPDGIDIDLVSWGGDVRIEALEGGLRGTLHDADIRARGIEGRVKLSLVNAASAEVENVHGDLEASSDAGAVHATGISGRAEVRSSDGAIVLRRTGGAVTAKALDGDIDLNEIAGPVTARTERGGIHVGFSTSGGGVIETERGDVVVTLPAREGVSLDARASDGSIDLAAGRFDGEHTGDRAVGTIGGGGPRLVVRTRRGDIRVSQR